MKKLGLVLVIFLKVHNFGEVKYINCAEIESFKSTKGHTRIALKHREFPIEVTETPAEIIEGCRL